ncbi:MAG TPA: hypothetical protein VFB04_00760, partial [Terriglobales bacterium]|nr:hypothetical protein [Terriglobales bacterium]
MLSDQTILRHMERQPHQSAGYKQLVREMGLRGAERQQLAERLQALVKSGRLVETARDRYTLAEHAAARQNLIAGRLIMHRDGYGFVVPNQGQRISIEGDIFIPPPAVGSAMHGDQVLVELTRKRETASSAGRTGLARGAGEDGRAEGRILRVLTHGNRTIVGKFHRGSRNNYVVPFDEKVTQEIIIPLGMEWPSAEQARVSPSSASVAHERETNQKSAARKKQSSRDRVLGDEAQRREWSDLEGVVVEVEIIDWPTPTQSPRGRVIEVIGYEDDFGVDVEIVIRKFHLPHRFPVEVLQEAQQFDPVIPATELRHRGDYRAVPIVTIDGETARDFDDAVSVR